MSSIFEQKAENKKLAKQYDSLTGTEQVHLRKTDRDLYDRLCAAKGIVHSYPTSQDFKNREIPTKLVSLDAARATGRWSEADVARYYKSSTVGNQDNLGALAKNDPAGYESLKLAKATYESVKPAESNIGKRIRPTLVPEKQAVEHYERLKSPAAVEGSEHTVIGQELGQRFNLPENTPISFSDYSNLLLLAASNEAAKVKP